MKNLFLGCLFLLFIVTLSYGSDKNELMLPDYKALAEGCKKASSIGCCMASVRAMEKGKYLQDTGKTLKDTTCPGGYQPEMMICIGSYRWCVPEKSSSVSN